MKVKNTKKKNYFLPLLYIIGNFLFIYTTMSIYSFSFDFKKFDIDTLKSGSLLCFLSTMAIIYWWKLEFSRKKYRHNSLKKTKN